MWNYAWAFRGQGGRGQVDPPQGPTIAIVTMLTLLVTPLDVSDWQACRPRSPRATADSAEHREQRQAYRDRPPMADNRRLPNQRLAQQPVERPRWHPQIQTRLG